MGTRIEDLSPTAENHEDSVRCLLRILESRTWLADLFTDIVAHCEIYGISACTPDWVSEQVAGPALFSPKGIEVFGDETAPSRNEARPR